MKNNQQGFETVGSIIILLVLIAVLAGGYYLYSQKSASQPEIPSSEIPSENGIEPEIPAAGIEPTEADFEETPSPAPNTDISSCGTTIPRCEFPTVPECQNAKWVCVE